MIRPGFSFANAAATNKAPAEFSKYAQGVNERVEEYTTRLKNVISDDNMGHGPYPVFIISHQSNVMRIAARNEYVARFLAYHLVKNKYAKQAHLDEQRYIAFAISDDDEGYKIGLSEDNNLAESTALARCYYRTNLKYKFASPLHWYNATASQTVETMESEGPIF
jgi:hypothetical protein